MWLIFPSCVYINYQKLGYSVPAEGMRDLCDHTGRQFFWNFMGGIVYK